MTTRTAKWIFYFGTLSSALLFLILTVDTHRQVSVLTNADQLSPEVIAGKKVFQKYNCNNCHTILGFGCYYAPDLTRVYRRVGEAYLRSVLAQPEIALANSFRKMPQQHLAPEEIDQLVVFFQWVNNIDTHDWPPQDSKKKLPSEARRLVGGATLSAGAALFKANDCFNCHQLQGIGGKTGPELDAVGAKLSHDAIEAVIKNPAANNPNAQMPAFSDLSDADLEALAIFLSQQTGGQP